jgi:3-hydroxyisobutyrate dehydrogenase-like beta-hydroxyacid dehydrogenase
MNAASQIGRVGLGSMGSRMAPNLVNNGCSVAICGAVPGADFQVSEKSG